MEKKLISALKTIYYISRSGMVTNKNDESIKTHLNKSGYKAVVLYRGIIEGKKKSRTVPIHRLVAEAFVENIHNKPQVNHIDGDKLNNYDFNLEWCTAQENITHSIKMGLSNINGEKNHFATLTEADVLRIRAKGKYSTYKQIAADNSVSMNTIVEILKRTTWKHI